MQEEEIKEIFKDCLEDFFFSENEYAPFNQLMDKLNHLIAVSNLEERAKDALETCEKFDVYMNNIDKLNAMINEFKGLVSMVRADFNKKKANDNSVG